MASSQHLNHAPADQQRGVATSFLKGLDLVTLLARHPEGLSMPMLRQRLKFPRTSIFRMLSTVEVYGLVARKGNRWCVTERFHAWCSSTMHREIKERYHESLSV